MYMVVKHCDTMTLGMTLAGDVKSINNLLYIKSPVEKMWRAGNEMMMGETLHCDNDER